jgi:hypothetical protein
MRRIIMVSRRVAGVVLGAVVAVSVPPAAARDDSPARERLERMQAAVMSLEPTSAELKKPALALPAKPLLRYSDPTRGGVGVNFKAPAKGNVLVDAGVWRLGAEGRPTALVTLEIYQAGDGSRVMSFEFLSLTDKKFSLQHSTESVHWDATGSALEMKDLPGAPKPAAAPAARLVQMRQLARRFAARERFKGESAECRLIAHPIDRYRAAAGGIDDGAIFALANGTNPEIGIVIESDGKRWRYGVLRLSSAESRVALDGREVAAFEAFNPHGRRDGAYNSGSYKTGPVK